MKIRFDSAKERHPSQENGVEVLYAPGKRMAFKLRWYLILFLILLPALWLAGTYGLSMLRVEAPALIRLQTLEVRARQAGQVENIEVRAGDHIEQGMPLVDMDNPEWRLRLAVLEPGQKEQAPQNLPTVSARSRAVLQNLVERARQRVAETQRLVASGAATRGELLDAQNARDARESELLAFERSVLLASSSGGTDIRYQQQIDAERTWLRGQLANLKLNAPENGRVAEVLAAPGENVGPGTPLLRIELQHPPQLWIYLDPSDVEYSQPGTAVTVRLPNGESRTARIHNPAESANPLPTDLRKPFSSPTRGLLALAEFDEPLPEEWRVDSLPVQVRFPGKTFRLFGMEI